MLNQHAAPDQPWKEHAAERADMHHRKRIEQRIAVFEKSRLADGGAGADPVVVVRGTPFGRASVPDVQVMVMMSLAVTAARRAASATITRSGSDCSRSSSVSMPCARRPSPGQDKSQHRQVAAQSVHHRRVVMATDRARGHEAAHAGKGDQIAKLVLPVLDRERAEDEAQPRRRKIEIGKLDTVRQLDADDVIALHPSNDQPLAEPIDIVRELIPAEPQRRRTHERCFVRRIDDRHGDRDRRQRPCGTSHQWWWCPKTRAKHDSRMRSDGVRIMPRLTCLLPQATHAGLATQGMIEAFNLWAAVRLTLLLDK